MSLNRTALKICALSISCLLSATFQTAHAVPDGDVYLNVPYAQDWERGEKLRFDLFLPDADQFDGPYPLVIYIHGGGWVSGDKSVGYIACQELTDRGYACATIDYRLAEKNWDGTITRDGSPEEIHDCKAAVRKLRGSAELLNLDPNRIAAFGSSAGGNLASLLGTTNQLAIFEGHSGEATYFDVSSDIQAVATDSSTFNFKRLGEIMENDPNRPELYYTSGMYYYCGGFMTDIPYVWAKLSPYFHCRQRNPHNNLARFAPHLIGYPTSRNGWGDRSGSQLQAEVDMEPALLAAQNAGFENVVYEMYPAPNGGHVFHRGDQYREDFFDKMVEFFNNNMLIE